MTTSTQKLKERIIELEDENVQLTEALESISSVVADVIDTDDDSDSEDDDESESITPRAKRNGIFTDALKYSARRVDKRKARKSFEKAAAADAKSKARLAEAKRRLEES